MKNDLEKYEIDHLGGAGEQGSRKMGSTGPQVEIEQLRKDNQRLVSMLKGTKEYEQFGNFIEDSGGNANRLPEPGLSP